MSRERPEAAAEALAEDRVRTVAKPEALDSGSGELCVGQEAASKADAPRHTTPARRIHEPIGARERPAGRTSCAQAQRHAEERLRLPAWQVAALQRRLMCKASKPRHAASQKKKGPKPLPLHQPALCERTRLGSGDDQMIEHANVEQSERGLKRLRQRFIRTRRLGRTA